jgi:hypothetical protein
MKTNTTNLCLILAAIGVAAAPHTAPGQDHGHLNVGAVGTSQSDPLLFDNGSVFATNSDYVYTLTYTDTGKYAGYYQGNITLTALAATPAHAGPVPNAPALGSLISAQLVSVDGPPGGAFAFWESGATNPTISLACGTTGTNTWRLSENDGSPGSDPYGHIHGRRFSATKPGVYTVAFRAFDFSTNGADGGPIHAPSDALKVYFQAGVNIKSIEPDVDHTHVTFAAPVGNSWIVQAADTVGSNAVWTTISTPVPGDDYFHEITDDHVVEGRRFYRTKSAP